MWKLVDFDKLQRMWGVRRADFRAALFALGGVLLIDVLLSLLILIYQASLPTATELGQVDVGGRATFISLMERRATSAWPDLVCCPRGC
ncbi:MAG: hypothetical protein QGM49_02535 [Actinomycetota bacterium]|nr:hypothetical protein [Actinomycetota bacterium]